MRELVYYAAVSLDGRIAAPDGAFDAFPIEGDHIDAINAEWADTVPGPLYDALGLTAPRGRFSTVLMGWNTFAAGLPLTDDPYPHLEQIVFSRTRTAADVGAGVRLTADDPRGVVADLKAQDGADIWLCGGGVLAAQLRDQIDRLVLKVNPVVFGDGLPLFAGGYAPDVFVRERSRAFDSGVVMNEYRRA
ncbi:dihydrofolate reductase family protein [Microbacterium sp. M3]|uniref:Dihydrofolate reductase family protein n=1 Tax=Microbacterium arthrosphaerae TaxID=792652 RepID=A0ABU4GWV2_9MICO|nr:MULTISPECIES: dihydrofolate reductase family protein [Microbacterium]MDW4571543.1 dihydrofolate reductase family protein [Microbacterium arthrosphaerae]MDW7605398.1 dihydrofolate reductase family protein [Microbacterium sp. M3]